MNWLYAVIFPLVGALIGWSTNWLAIKMIFRPYDPVNIPLLNYSLQGVMPKRRHELARSIGEVVERELFTAQDLMTCIDKEDLTGDIMQTVETGVRLRVMDRLPAFVPLSIKGVISDALVEALKKEMPALINGVWDRVSGKMEKNLPIGSIVEQKLNNYPIERIEAIILAVSSRELRHVEILGGVLGFIIGLLQVALLYVVG